MEFYFSEPVIVVTRLYSFFFHTISTIRYIFSQDSNFAFLNMLLYFCLSVMNAFHVSSVSYFSIFFHDIILPIFDFLYNCCTRVVFSQTVITFVFLVLLFQYFHPISFLGLLQCYQCIIVINFQCKI